MGLAEPNLEMKEEPVIAEKEVKAPATKTVPVEVRLKVELLASKMQNVQLQLQNIQHAVQQQLSARDQLQREMSSLRLELLQTYGFDLATHYLNEDGVPVPNPQTPNFPGT